MTPIDIVVGPGGGWTSRRPTGAWAEYRCGEWLPLLAAAASTARVLAGVCTGTMLLAHAGVIGQRRACTRHAARDELAATGATVATARVVDVGDLITCDGVTSGIDLALHLVARETSEAVAEQIARRLEHSWTRPG